MAGDFVFISKLFGFSHATPTGLAVLGQV